MENFIELVTKHVEEFEAQTAKIRNLESEKETMFEIQESNEKRINELEIECKSNEIKLLCSECGKKLVGGTVESEKLLIEDERKTIIKHLSKYDAGDTLSNVDIILQKVLWNEYG